MRARRARASTPVPERAVPENRPALSLQRYEVPPDPFKVIAEPTPASFQYTALFNISADPHERFDRSADFPDVMAVMFERLTTRYVPRTVRAQIVGDDGRAREHWARTGYVGPWLTSAVSTACAGDRADRRAEFEALTWGDDASDARPCRSDAALLTGAVDER